MRQAGYGGVSSLSYLRFTLKNWKANYIITQNDTSKTAVLHSAHMPGHPLATSRKLYAPMGQGLQMLAKYHLKK